LQAYFLALQRTNDLHLIAPLRWFADAHLYSVDPLSFFVHFICCLLMQPLYLLVSMPLFVDAILRQADFSALFEDTCLQQLVSLC
jgi:hypothetical protein